MADVPLNEVYHFDATTHVPSTGAVSDADSAPTFDVFEEDTDTPILAAQTMTKRTSKTGDYRGAITISAGNGFQVGKFYVVVVSATVDSVAGKESKPPFRVVAAETTAGSQAWNSEWDAEVQSEVADALAAYDPPTNAEMEARTIAAASYATATGQTTITTHLTDIKGGTWNAATDSLEAIRDQGDAAWVTANTASLATTANQTTIITHLTDIKGATWSASTDTLEGIRDRGDAAWVTANISGLATGTNISDLQTHGDSTWATATGFSTHSAADVKTALTADTLTYEQTMTLLVALASGVTSVNTTNPDAVEVTFMKRDGETAFITLVYGNTSGTRATSTLA